ncbi:MAG TPA: cupin domain-containing protein [Gemmataceae bacterium]|nr:cupin domain-containing protein [Gemmataceae bacterium]
MAIAHAAPAEVIDIHPWGTKLTPSRTTVLIKTKNLEVIRMVIPAGERHSKHHVPGEITVQCLEGRIIFGVDDVPHELKAGQMLYLAGGQPHDVEGVEDSSVLLTILLGKHDSSDACNDEYAQQHEHQCESCATDPQEEYNTAGDSCGD